MLYNICTSVHNNKQDRQCNYKRNIETLALKPFCHGNAIRVTYFEFALHAGRFLFCCRKLIRSVGFEWMTA